MSEPAEATVETPETGADGGSPPAEAPEEVAAEERPADDSDETGAADESPAEDAPDEASSPDTAEASLPEEPLSDDSEEASPPDAFPADDSAEDGAADEPSSGAEYEPGDIVFYPQLGHCEVGEVIHDERIELDLLELNPRDAEPGNRILVPVGHLAARGIRRAGDAPGTLEEVLGSDFEPTIEDAAERLDLITAQEREGTVASLALALKRLHLRHEMKTISREESKRRTRIRRWLVAEHMVETEGTSGQAQSAITRLLARTMNAVREREKEAARERRRQERAERKAEAERRARRRRGRG